MQKFIELKDYIFSKGNKLKKNPELLLYYVTLGTWCEDSNLNASISVGKEKLKNTNLFSAIEFVPCGSVEIQSLYRKTKAVFEDNIRDYLGPNQDVNESN